MGNKTILDTTRGVNNNAEREKQSSMQRKIFLSEQTPVSPRYKKIKRILMELPNIGNPNKYKKNSAVRMERSITSSSSQEWEKQLIHLRNEFFKSIHEVKFENLERINSLQK